MIKKTKIKKFEKIKKSNIYRNFLLKIFKINSRLHNKTCQLIKLILWSFLVLSMIEKSCGLPYPGDHSNLITPITNSTESYNDQIINNVTREQKLITLTPPICEGKTFCEDTPYYPDKIVENALENHRELRNLAGTDFVDVAQRNGYAEDAPMCISIERLVFPKSGLTKQGNWLFIANYGDFTQGVVIETCLNEGTECNLINGFSEGYETKCHQKFIYRRLAAITNIGKIEPTDFRFPASCCCHIKHTGNALFGLNTKIHRMKNRGKNRGRMK